MKKIVKRSKSACLNCSFKFAFSFPEIKNLPSAWDAKPTEVYLHWKRKNGMTGATRPARVTNGTVGWPDDVFECECHMVKEKHANEVHPKWMKVALFKEGGKVGSVKVNMANFVRVSEDGKQLHGGFFPQQPIHLVVKIDQHKHHEKFTCTVYSNVRSSPSDTVNNNSLSTPSASYLSAHTHSESFSDSLSAYSSVPTTSISRSSRGSRGSRGSDGSSRVSFPTNPVQPASTTSSPSPQCAPSPSAVPTPSTAMTTTTTASELFADDVTSSRRHSLPPGTLGPRRTVSFAENDPTRNRKPVANTLSPPPDHNTSILRQRRNSNPNVIPPSNAVLENPLFKNLYDSAVSQLKDYLPSAFFSCIPPPISYTQEMCVAEVKRVLKEYKNCFGLNNCFVTTQFFQLLARYVDSTLCSLMKDLPKLCSEESALALKLAISDLEDWCRLNGLQLIQLREIKQITSVVLLSDLDQLKTPSYRAALLDNCKLLTEETVMALYKSAHQQRARSELCAHPGQARPIVNTSLAL
eukprot:TRINITY_DN68429_c0_g1_i1.p1 TRINITY_DN68429_c0_g1~~TRINITY_DN68429_c0_g1_i1.p1  ORF type:complete len:523 (-),score=36.32 TRINITY_DN68429_c0_g1_i1:89-1657(-)